MSAVRQWAALGRIFSLGRTCQ